MLGCQAPLTYGRKELVARHWCVMCISRSKWTSHTRTSRKKKNHLETPCLVLCAGESSRHFSALRTPRSHGLPRKDGRRDATLLEGISNGCVEQRRGRWTRSSTSRWGLGNGRKQQQQRSVWSAGATVKITDQTQRHTPPPSFSVQDTAGNQNYADKYWLACRGARRRVRCRTWPKCHCFHEAEVGCKDASVGVWRASRRLAVCLLGAQQSTATTIHVAMRLVVRFLSGTGESLEFEHTKCTVEWCVTVANTSSSTVASECVEVRFVCEGDVCRRAS